MKTILDVIAVHSNPIRWVSRKTTHDKFEQQMLATEGVRLTTVECAFGDRPWELEDHPQINRVRVRSNSLVWHKENLINIGIARLPADWQYAAWVDADISFRRDHWATETIHALQQYKIVQPWSDAYDLGPNDEHLQHHRSFMHQWWHKEPVVPDGSKFWSFNGGPYVYPHSGYAWAATRAFIDEVGGLIDFAAMGAGDHHMALALVGQAHKSVPGGVHPNYLSRVLRWQDRALLHVNGRMGFVHGTVEHLWHGRKVDRRYVDRWDMIVRHRFNPEEDLKANTFGVIEFCGNKPELIRDMDMYFRQRNEDVNSID